MIKHESEWTFTEWQSHAKGFLQGLALGVFCTLTMGASVWLLLS